MQSDFVIEHEGFLLKRGAGYNADKRKTGNPNQLAGKAEKLRWFVLMRKEGNNLEAEQAVLSYYTKQPKKGKEQRPKGKVNLKSGFLVTIRDDVNVELHTPGRIYYLRPNAELGSAEARTTAGRWHSALDLAINKIKEWEANQGPKKEKTGSFTRRTMDRLMRTMSRAEAKNISAGAFVDENDVVINRPGRLGDDNGDGTYGSVWSINGLDGYNALIAHFGPVQIDLDRMHSHVKNRVQLLEEQVKVMEDYSKNSAEPVVKLQKSTYYALRALYNDDKSRLDSVDNTRKQLIENILNPLDQLRNDIKSELDSVVTHYRKYTSRLDRVRKAVLLSSQEVKEKQARYKAAQDELKRLGMSPGLVEASDKYLSMEDDISEFSEEDEEGSLITKQGSRKGGSKFLKTALTSFKNRLGTNPTGTFADGDIDLQELQDELLISMKTRKDKEEYFYELEKKHTANMMSAMNKLEAVERRRLKSQKKFILLLNDIESKLFTELSIKTASEGKLVKVVEQIDPEADMKMTADALLAQAKKKQKKPGTLRVKNQLDE